MKLIAGLGNPGSKYENNRHNLGFMVANAFATEKGLAFLKNRDLLSDIARAEELVIIKPQTFMNRSGDALRSVSNFYKIEPHDVLVINDDVDLEFGKIRLSFGGASAGHRGVESAIAGMATADFNRLRIGVGRPTSATGDGKGAMEVESFVLLDFLPEEKAKLGKVLKAACEAINSFLDSGIASTMNRFN